MTDGKRRLEIHKAILKLDEIKEPFPEFGPDHPKIGDFVSPNTYYSSHFTYKLEKPGSSKLTKEEVQSTYWVCDQIRYSAYSYSMRFKSVGKINGKRRSITYFDPWNFTAEIVDMPEKAKLIIKYKKGELTLIELLKILKEKGYYVSLYFKTIFYDISGEEYLEVMEALEKEKEEKK